MPLKFAPWYTLLLAPKALHRSFERVILEQTLHIVVGGGGSVQFLCSGVPLLPVELFQVIPLNNRCGVGGVLGNCFDMCSFGNYLFLGMVPVMLPFGAWLEEGCGCGPGGAAGYRGGVQSGCSCG